MHGETVKLKRSYLHLRWRHFVL